MVIVFTTLQAGPDNCVVTLSRVNWARRSSVSVAPLLPRHISSGRAWRASGGSRACQNKHVNPEHPLNARAALIGLRSNAGPLDNTAVRFGAGVTALYGQNGAGKTWILNSLRSVLSGQFRGVNQLLCQFERDSVVYNWVMTNLAASERQSWYSSQSTVEADALMVRSAVENWFTKGGRFFKPYNHAQEVANDFIEELVRAKSIALIPTGSTSAAEWDVWLCLPRDPVNFPACAREVAAYLTAVKTAEDFAETISDEFGDWQDEAGISDEEYDLKEQAEEKRYEELSRLEWEYIYTAVAGLVWDYHPQAMPDDVRRMLDPVVQDALPLPVVKLFEARNIPLVLEDDNDDADIDSATCSAFAKRFEGELITTDVSMRITKKMKQWVRELEQSANYIYSLLLQDAPALTLEMRPIGSWVRESALRWSVAYGSYGHIKVSVSDLSRAESRWARVAVRRALDSAGTANVVVIDEPEAALHRAAERKMAMGLAELTTLGPQVIVATHSPEVLDARTTECLHVVNTGGKTTIGAMPTLGPETLSALGLSPSDLLGLYRTFLLVEGAHDEVVLRTLCGDFLDTERVKVIAMRGGRKLPGTVESQLLFDLSNAHLVALLDNVQAEEIEDTWIEAQTRCLSSGAQNAIEFLSQAFKHKKGDEYLWIVQWLNRALDKGVYSRIEPYGLAARDIIEYLPVELLVPKAKKSWEVLREDHDLAVRNLDKSKGLHDFKRWLAHSYGANISVSDVRTAAESMQNIPEEFQKLIYRLREIGVRPRAQ